MSIFFRFPDAVTRSPAVDAWFDAGDNPLRQMARPWYERLRSCGPDVRELMHDGHPTACVEDAAFAYIDAFTAHVNVGFYFGSELPDPAGLLLGTGKRMRHVKLTWGEPVNAADMNGLIVAAYSDVRGRLRAE